MSEEGNKKLYAHYKGLSEGNLKSGNPVRDELIVSDAKKHLADLVKKNPSLEHEPIVVDNLNDEPLEPTPKSKGKK